MLNVILKTLQKRVSGYRVFNVTDGKIIVGHIIFSFDTKGCRGWWSSFLPAFKNRESGRQWRISGNDIQILCFRKFSFCTYGAFFVLRYSSELGWYFGDSCYCLVNSIYSRSMTPFYVQMKLKERKIFLAAHSFADLILGKMLLRSIKFYCKSSVSNLMELNEQTPFIIIMIFFSLILPMTGYNSFNPGDWRKSILLCTPLENFSGYPSTDIFSSELLCHAYRFN